MVRSRWSEVSVMTSKEDDASSEVVNRVEVCSAAMVSEEEEEDE